MADGSAGDNIYLTEPAFAPISRYDQAGIIWIVILYTLIFSTIACATRIYLKHNKLGNDDWLYLAATVACIGHVVSLMLALHNGLGSAPAHTDISRSTYIHGGRATFAGAVFLLVALALAKCSVGIFMQRLLAQNLNVLYWTCFAMVAIFAAWGIGAVLGIGVGCDVNQYILNDAGNACGNQATKWWAITAFDCATEIMIMAVPIIIVRPLQMSGALKFQVVSAFLFRIGVIAAALTHAYYIQIFGSAVYPSMALVRVIVTAECELCWSLLSATIPNLQSFMRSFNIGFGQELGSNAMQSSLYGSRGHSRGKHSIGNAVALSNLSKSSRTRASSPMTGQDPAALGGPSGMQADSSLYDIQVGRGSVAPGDALSIRSGRSQELIIRKDVTMTVQNDAGRLRSKGML